MKIGTVSKDFEHSHVPFISSIDEAQKQNQYTTLIVDKDIVQKTVGIDFVFWGNLNEVKNFSAYKYFFSKSKNPNSVLEFLEKNTESVKKKFERQSIKDLEEDLEELKKKTLKLQIESDQSKKESVNIKGLGEYVIRLLGVNTIEQLVYETESLRILKYKRIKVSLIYIDSEDGFLCTRNTTRKIKGLSDVEDWMSLTDDREKLANILARPVLNHFKIYAEELESGDRLYALFESQEEFLEKDYFLTMLKKLLFTNFVRVLQSERLLKNSSLLSQAFQQIQGTSMLIGSDYRVLFSNKEDSVNQKCYQYLFRRAEPCTHCPINKIDEEYSGREVQLLDHNYVVHSSKVKEFSHSFYLHIYETSDESKKRESIKIQRGKLQSLGLVTQALTHELNNPLTGIRELSSEMKEDFDAQTAKDLEEISKSSERCLSIIESLKKFSSKKIEFNRMNFSKTIKSSLVLTKVLTRNTSVFVDLDDELWISGSATLLSQLIFNIIKNSVEAMSGEGSISIKLSKLDSQTARLQFEDSGPGLPQNMKDVSLFGTKNKAEGSGFGLFLVNEFVKLHKGKLSFGNLAEKGAYFSIDIPLN